MTGNLGPDEESVLRQGIAEFAEAEAGPGPTVTGLLVRCNRARRRHRVVWASAAGVCVIAVATGGVAFAQRSATFAAPPATSLTAARVTGLPPLPLPARSEDARSRGGLPLPQPAHPVVGTSYPYNWYAHCGMVYITFDGRAWKVDHLVMVPSMHPDAHGITSEPPDVPGYVTLLSPTALRFDAPTYLTGVSLHGTSEVPPLCS